MKKIVLINGSPKVNEASASEHICEMVGSHINRAGAEKTLINVRKSYSKGNPENPDEMFDKLYNADALIIVFPLYVYCMPGILTRFLEDYYRYYEKKGRKASVTKVYAVVNCGFPEPEINLEAVRVIKSFSEHINAAFRFGVLIGGGGMLIGSGNANIMKKTLDLLGTAFSTIAADIDAAELKSVENFHIPLNFPRRLYLYFGGKGWISMARKNGLKKKELYRQPYL